MLECHGKGNTPNLIVSHTIQHLLFIRQDEENNHHVLVQIEHQTQRCSSLIF
jgi:hypothetical protein